MRALFFAVGTAFHVQPLSLPAQQALEVIMRTYQQPPYNTFECETLEPSKASTDKLISANALLADGSENSVYPAFAEREQPRTLRRATAPPPHGACGWRAMRLGAWQRRRQGPGCRCSGPRRPLVSRRLRSVLLQVDVP